MSLYVYTSKREIGTCIYIHSYVVLVYKTQFLPYQRNVLKGSIILMVVVIVNV
jgi:hypothetical protein